MCWHATAKADRQKRRFQPGPRPPQRRRLLQRGSAGGTTPAKPAAGKGASPTLGEQVLALADGKTHRKSRLHAGGPPEPCRRRHCPPQASWPHRTARREALRHAVGEDGATRCGLIFSAMNRRVLRSRNRLSRFRRRPSRGHPLLSPAKGRTQPTFPGRLGPSGVMFRLI